jgi:hypothetical protein
MMSLDTKLFTPDKWWSYEGADEDRPTANSVQQETKVSLGGRFEVNHGAQVLYTVREFPDAKKAHGYVLESQKRITKPIKHGKLALKRLHNGSEGVSLVLTMMANESTPVSVERRSIVRFDKYVVLIDANANMKAIGPRPKQGARRWLSEPVYDKVFSAAMEKWSNYKALIPNRS